MCNGESSAETLVKVSLKAGLGLFKRNIPRLEKCLLKKQVFDNCLPSERKETPRGGENGGVWLSLSGGEEARLSLIFRCNWDKSSRGLLEVRLCL